MIRSTFLSKFYVLHSKQIATFTLPIDTHPIKALTPPRSSTNPLGISVGKTPDVISAIAKIESRRPPAIDTSASAAPSVITLPSAKNSTIRRDADHAPMFSNYADDGASVSEFGEV